MSIKNNSQFALQIEEYLRKKLPIKLGVNKKNELVRLVYEICRARDISIEDVISQAKIEEIIEGGRQDLFHKCKRAFLEIRYPSISPGDDPHIMPFDSTFSDQECSIWDSEIHPKRIFIEESVKGLEWTDSFLQNFPHAEQILIKDVKEGLKRISKPVSTAVYNARRENLFLVEGKSAFIKICPCTKECVRCGYWILNIGFGCPVDCAYCYLQMYSNSPGLILPANIEDYYANIEELDKKAAGKIRIGTGEFTDSLALDRYTKYSSYLIPFFRNTKNLIFELKTKVSEIDNVLKEEPHDNIVISWSMNTPVVAERYEKGGASISERISAAREASRKGYKIGFHFDPIVYYLGWEKDYKCTIKTIFSFDEIRQNTVWISLGTLRYTPGLKQEAEKRFEENLMFYQGEFFIDIDGKLRYPRDLRIDMYNKMAEWIKSFDTSPWIYLCMEPRELWKKTILDKASYVYN